MEAAYVRIRIQKVALFVWMCVSCQAPGRGILPKRPTDLTCLKCGAKVRFLTAATSSTKEVIDNGLMYKPLERDPNVEAQLRERTALAEKPEDTIV